MKKIKTNEKSPENAADHSDSQHIKNPNTLSDICIHYTALNLHLVDSLMDFPDIVGIKIFQKSEELGKFKSPSLESQTALKLFCESYEGDVLRCLSLCNNHLCFNNFYELITLFQHLTQLDLSGNCIGDDHEILHHISNLNRLQTLCLRKNSLSDDGIRKLTSPLRMLKKGPVNLLHLCLSENASISSSVLRYLKCFQLLKVLDVSNTCVRETGIKEALKSMNLVRHDGVETITNIFTVNNKGWATPIIETWKELTLLPPDKPSKLLNRNFYKKSLKPATESTVGMKPKKKSNLIFIKATGVSDCDISSKPVPKTPLVSLEIENNKLKEIYGIPKTGVKKITLSSLMDSW